MNYTFERKEPVYDKIVFALCLDRQRMKERVLIGAEYDVICCLETGKGDVYFDEASALGEMLIHFATDSKNEWVAVIMELFENYQSLIKMLNRKASAKSILEFLKKKYEQGNAAEKYAAIRIWNNYLICFNQNQGPERFKDSMLILCRPFCYYASYNILGNDAKALSDMSAISGDSHLQLYFPNVKRPLECAIAYNSFQPLIFYYLRRLEEWGLCFVKCKICGENFLARSRRYELCSERCRAVQASENKQQHTDRIKDKPHEQLYISTYNYWYNHLRRLKKDEAANAEKIKRFQNDFDQFCAEGKRRKKEVAAHKMSLSEFSSWLLKQNDFADTIVK